MTVIGVLTAAFAIAVAMSTVMTVAWLVRQSTGNSGWIDTIWSFGVGLTGAAAALALLGADAAQPRQIMVACLATAWALRLGLHIASRSARMTDDPRYAELIQGWGKDAPRRMFRFLQIQALVSIPLILSIFLAAHRPGAELGGRDFVAIVIVALAVFGEGLADWQLQLFRSNAVNKGGVIDTGLWRWSRHPNYFFETLGWLAYPVVAIDLSGQYLWGWLALSAPACMYWLLVHVSGIPPLEQHMLRSRGDAFRAYQRRTNAFFLGPSRR